jgi:heat shock protein HslJ
MHPPSPTAALLPRTAACLAAGLLAVVAGCASSDSDATRGFHPATPDSVAALAKAELRLTKLVADGAEVALPEDPPITMRFGGDGKIGGRSAVNRYFGSYEWAGDGAIRWPGSGLGMTRMAGPAPAMELESKFSRALTGTTRLLTSTNGARFESGDAKQALEFTR